MGGEEREVRRGGRRGERGKGEERERERGSFLNRKGPPRLQPLPPSRGSSSSPSPVYSPKELSSYQQ